MMMIKFPRSLVLALMITTTLVQFRTLSVVAATQQHKHKQNILAPMVQPSRRHRRRLGAGGTHYYHHTSRYSHVRQCTTNSTQANEENQSYYYRDDCSEEDAMLILVLVFALVAMCAIHVAKRRSMEENTRLWRDSQSSSGGGGVVQQAREGVLRDAVSSLSTAPTTLEPQSGTYNAVYTDDDDGVAVPMEWQLQFTRLVALSSSGGEEKPAKDDDDDAMLQKEESLTKDKVASQAGACWSIAGQGSGPDGSVWMISEGLVSGHTGKVYWMEQQSGRRPSNRSLWLDRRDAAALTTGTWNLAHSHLVAGRRESSSNGGTSGCYQHFALVDIVEAP